MTNWLFWFLLLDIEETCIDESDTGKNETFLDLSNGLLMTRDSFVGEIQLGKYPGYMVVEKDDSVYPVSKADGDQENNLG